jgi:hypothetical protein
LTTEYREGDEDIYLVVRPISNGYVEVGIFLTHSNNLLYSFALQGEKARNVAQSLTMASWRAEDSAR